MAYVVAILHFPDPTIVYTRVFEDARAAIVDNLRLLGETVRPLDIRGPDVETAARLARDETLILLGWNVLASYPKESVRLPGRTIFYQLEAVFRGSHWTNPQHLQWLSRYRLWEYNRRNLSELSNLHQIEGGRYVPLGSCPSWFAERVAPQSERDIDVLFFGHLFPRRRTVVDAIVAAGVKVEIRTPANTVFGRDRDVLVDRAKVILNLSGTGAGVFESSRVLPAMSRGAVVVSEVGRDPEEEAPFTERGGLISVPYDSLASIAVSLVRSQARREEISANAVLTMRQRTMLETLRAAVADEKQKRRVYAILNVRDRLSTLTGMVHDVARLGMTALVVDNDSSYPPLLAWEKNAPCEVRRVKNLGAYAPWRSGIVASVYSLEVPYVVSDADLDLSHIPPNAVDVLMRGFRDHPWATKIALSLRTRDLPPPLRALVEANEQKAIVAPCKGGHLADTDTTFAMYVHENPFREGEDERAPYHKGRRFFSGVRLAAPYDAIHVPWYRTEETLTEEDRYYLAHRMEGPEFSSWTVPKRSVLSPRRVSIRIAIRLVEHAGGSGAHVFGEIIDALRHGLVETGHQVVVEPANSGAKWSVGATNILLGAFLLASPKPPTIAESPPEDSIIIQTEPFIPSCGWFSPAYIELLKRHRVWDYDAKNVDALRAMGVDALHVPFVLHPSRLGALKLRPPHARNTDVAFVGMAAGRRRNIIASIQKAGVSVEAPARAFAEQRAALYERSKVVLNLHFYDGAVPLETARLSYAVGNGCAVVSERSRDPDEDARWEAAGVTFASVEEMPAKVRELVANPARRAELGARGIAWSRERYAAWLETLRTVVSSP